LRAYHTRESLVIEAKFLREDLPYFTELLGEIISQTKFTGKLITKMGGSIGF
jgi:ubiquinol-cytochrome c reductase core subunit 2